MSGLCSAAMWSMASSKGSSCKCTIGDHSSPVHCIRFIEASLLKFKVNVTGGFERMSAQFLASNEDTPVSFKIAFQRLEKWHCTLKRKCHYALNCKHVLSRRLENSRASQNAGSWRSILRLTFLQHILLLLQIHMLSRLYLCLVLDIILTLQAACHSF